MTERVSEAAAGGQQITPCRVGIPSFACRKPLLNEKMMSMFLNDTVAAAPRVQVPKRTSPRNQPSAKSSNKQAMTLTDFSDDILHQIYSFIPTIQDLRNFSQVNKRACQWMFGSKTTDPLFDAAYQRAFGETSCQTSGRKTWKELYRIRQCLSQAASGMNHQSELNTVGVLSLELESEAVGYDHPRHFRDGQCLGYFGMAQVFPRGDSPIAIWGDFNGIVIVPSIEALLSSDTLPTKSFQRIAGNSQVLCVLVSNVYYDPYENSTCFFLGYASGHVRVVKAMQEGDRYSYEVISTAQAHTDEVTALAILPFHNPCIASSSVDGTVIFYPNSIQGLPTLCSPAEACKTPNEKILCFGATRGEHGHVFLCTGSSEGVLTRWSPFDSMDFFKWKKTSSIPLGTVASAPTLLEFLHGTSDTIVVGTNSGSLLTYRMSLSLEAPLLCGFNPLKHEATAHIGAVESIKTVGNLLLTSGAHESHLMAWDIRTLSPVGSIMAHPGHLHLSTGSIFRCAVISVLVCREREALVTLYRDGNIREYSYSEASSDMRRVASDKAVQSFPPTILPLKSFMENADDSLSWRMRMRVIQAGLQNKKEPHSSFEGLDGVKYEDAKSSFDYFSGLSSCTICTRRGEGVSLLLMIAFLATYVSSIHD